MANSGHLWTAFTQPLVQRNPVTLQILGICSALAVTTTLATALTMAASLTVVLGLSAVLISLIRRHIPDTIRLIVQIVIIASLVIVIDQFLQAYFAEISRALSVYVGLITTNCLVLGRTEAYARFHAPWPAFVDAIGNGLGYSLVLAVIGAMRELFGKGELLGFEILPLVTDGGWFTPLNLMLLAPSGFFLLGGLVWAIRTILPEQIEVPETTPPDVSEARR
jgi:Na+-transporting NADH:ubiquinone oxidoreductase subunit D